MFYIRELILSPEQEEHIWSKHHVTPEEAEEACDANPWPLRGRDGSYSIFGQTEGGRYLVVMLYPRGHGVYSVATARDMTPVEQRQYRRRQGR